MDRKQFEEWFKTTDAYKLLEEMNYFKIDLFIFKEHRSQYQHTTVQIAYMTWQHQQAKVEELQNQLSLQRQRVKAFEDELTSSRNYGDELQKRVDALEKAEFVLARIRSIASKRLLESILIKEVRQALKGDSDASK